MAFPHWTLCVVAAVVAAGCVTPPALDPNAAGDRAGAVLAFAPPVTVDASRVASEPSVKVAADGTVFVAAPTGTVKYATRPQDATAHADKGILQGAIWKSTDDGATFEFKAGLGPTPYHTYQPGGGDSDIAIDRDGRIYITDQWGVVAEWVQFSTDNGETWTASDNPGSTAPPVDRQWLWPDPEIAGTVYLSYNNIGEGIAVAKTTDGAKTWGQAVIATPISTAPGPIVAVPGLVAFSVAQGNDLHFVSSTDGGVTWADQVITIKDGTFQDFFPQTFADLAGNVYVAWPAFHDDRTLMQYVVTQDLGATWSPQRTLFEQEGLGLFLWGVGGDAGRIGFTWYEAEDTAGDWFVRSAVVTDALTDTPQVFSARVTDDPIRTGEPCQDGAFCTSGRELGDFQQCAVTPDGRLVVSYVDVLSPDEGGRVMFAKQDAGPRLILTPPDVWVV